MLGYAIEWDDPMLARALGLIRNELRDGCYQGRRHIIDPQSGAMVAAIYEHCESQVLARITGKGTFILRMPGGSREAVLASERLHAAAVGLRHGVPTAMTLVGQASIKLEGELRKAMLRREELREAMLCTGGPTGPLTTEGVPADMRTYLGSGQAAAAREECHPAVCVDPQPPSQMKSQDDSAQDPGDERRPCTCPIALLMTGPCRCGGR